MVTDLNWSDGRNYALSQFFIRSATAGFILGEGVLGETPLGPDGPFTDITRDFTSVTINSPCIVEDGLFLHREVEACTITTTDPDHLDLKGRRVGVVYGTKTVFRGTVNETSLAEAVSVGEARQLGNTATRTHRVSLRCTAGDEYFANRNAPARAFNGTAVSARLASYLSIASADTGPDDDVDAGVMDNVGTAIATGTVTTLADPPRTFLDTFRDLLKRAGRMYAYRPWDSRIDSEAWSRPASGATTIASALRFTDDPALLSGVPLAAYEHRSHDDRTISYTDRGVTEDPSMFATGLTVSNTQGGVDQTHGPWATNASNRRNDVTVDLGELSNPHTGIRPESVAIMIRNWVATLPLKGRSVPFTSSLTTPLQSLHQIGGRTPGLATLNRDGVNEQVAIIGVHHTITPGKWMVGYDCAPPHLLTRVGDFDPSTPRDMTVSQPGAGSAVTVTWKTPDSMPRHGGPLFRSVRACDGLNFTGGMTPVDTNGLGVTFWEYFSSLPGAFVSAEAEDPGDAQSLVIPFGPELFPGTWLFAVQYTTQFPIAITPEMFDEQQLIGQPALVSFVVT